MFALFYFIVIQLNADPNFNTMFPSNDAPPTKPKNEFVSAIVKDTFSLNSVAQVASKYFYLQSIDSNKVTLRICVGFNGLSETEKKRNPDLESFCFSVINNAMNGEEFDPMNELSDAVQEASAMHLGIAKSDVITRMQGIVYFIMYKNEKLRIALKKEYEAKKDILPFVMVD